MAVIELEGVEKSYGSHEVLKGINLEVEEGEIYGLLGPNGAGKTTLFQTIIGLLKQDAGSIKINGEEHGDNKDIRRKLGYLPSDISFYEKMTARENLRFFADLADKDPDFEKLLEIAGIQDSADRKVGEFSTGMKKRLGIAQSMIKDPEIIIYDEPTTGLDPEGKRSFRQLVQKINRERNLTVIISSHITTEISPLCDRFGVLHEGKIKASGTREELSNATESDLEIVIEVEKIDAAKKALENLNLDYKTDDNRVELSIKEDIRDQIFEELVDMDAGVKKFILDEETLESAYMRLTEG
jgi:ABC-2 type transport system ATP-binding protein